MFSSVSLLSLLALFSATALAAPLTSTVPRGLLSNRQAASQTACNSALGLSYTDDLSSIISALYSSGGTFSLSAGVQNCATVSCFQDAAVVVCNEQADADLTVNDSDVADFVTQIQADCSDSNGDGGVGGDGLSSDGTWEAIVLAPSAAGC